MNKRKYSACMAALTASALVFLGGCQLAVPEGEETDAGQDRLTGVFVTTEYLDLFDMESWISDNIGDIMKGGATVSASDSGKYGGRLYAELVEEAFTDSMGETQFRHDYAFPGLEGMFYGTFLVKPENYSMAEAEGYWLSTGSDGMLSLKNHHKTTDEGEELEQEAVIYIPSDRGEVCFYFNPVYQTPDGAVYLTAGQGMATNGLRGGAMSQTMTGTGTLREGDKIKSFSSEIKITVDSVDVPECVVLIRMDAAHRELGRTELVPGAFPESLTPEDGTAYILMETYCGGEVSRSLLQPGDRAAEAFYRMENDICNKDYVQILWPETVIFDGFADHEDLDYLAYGTETQVFDSIRAMKEELDKNLQADTVSFYELQGLSDVFHESGVELVTAEYFIYYSNADKVVAFMPFASESDLSARKDDLLSSHGTYENLLANKLIHDVVKSEIPTDSGIAYECTYSTRVKTGLKIRYYECQDPATGRNYILSVDLSSDGNLENAALFVFDGMNSFMCGGNASEIASLEAASELFSVVVE